MPRSARHDGQKIVAATYHFFPDGMQARTMDDDTMSKTVSNSRTGCNEGWIAFVAVQRLYCGSQNRNGEKKAPSTFLVRLLVGEEEGVQGWCPRLTACD